MNYTDLLNNNVIYSLSSPKNITMHDIYINLARMLALKSTCLRGKAGCVVTLNGRIISTGYNGSPSGEKECIERIECRQKGTYIETYDEDIHSQLNDYEIKTEGCFDSLHAETNAFGFCAKNGIKTDKSVVYLTGPPCKSCAQLMVAVGVKTLYYDNKPYRNDDGLVYCKEYGIKLVKYDNKPYRNDDGLVYCKEYGIKLVKMEEN